MVYQTSPNLFLPKGPYWSSNSSGCLSRWDVLFQLVFLDFLGGFFLVEGAPIQQQLDEHPEYTKPASISYYFLKYVWHLSSLWSIAEVRVIFISSQIILTYIDNTNEKHQNYIRIHSLWALVGELSHKLQR